MSSLFTVTPLNTAVKPLQMTQRGNMKTVTTAKAFKGINRSSSVNMMSSNVAFGASSSVKLSSNNSFVPQSMSTQTTGIANSFSMVGQRPSYQNRTSRQGPRMGMSVEGRVAQASTTGAEDWRKVVRNTKAGIINPMFGVSANANRRSRVVMQAQADDNAEVQTGEVGFVEAAAEETIEVTNSATEGEEKPAETTTSEEPVITKAEDSQPSHDSPSDIESSKSYTLYYFDAMGRAEPIRLLLNHAGVDFTDKKFTRGEWGSNKESMPGKKVPILELDDGTKLGQSVSILRFLGKKYGYYPEDPLEAHKVDYLVDMYNDKFLGIALNSALPEKLLELPFSVPSNKAIPDWLDFLEPYLNDGQFLCGEKLTIADFLIGGLYVNTIINDKALFGKEKWNQLLKDYPNFKSYGERFREANQVYLDKRGFSKF